MRYLMVLAMNQIGESGAEVGLSETDNLLEAMDWLYQVDDEDAYIFDQQTEKKIYVK